MRAILVSICLMAVFQSSLRANEITGTEIASKIAGASYFHVTNANGIIYSSESNILYLNPLGEIIWRFGYAKSINGFDRTEGKCQFAVNETESRIAIITYGSNHASVNILEILTGEVILKYILQKNEWSFFLNDYSISNGQSEYFAVGMSNKVLVFNFNDSHSQLEVDASRYPSLAIDNNHLLVGNGSNITMYSINSGESVLKLNESSEIKALHFVDQDILAYSTEFNIRFYNIAKGIHQGEIYLPEGKVMEIKSCGNQISFNWLPPRNFFELPVSVVIQVWNMDDLTLEAELFTDRPCGLVQLIDKGTQVYIVEGNNLMKYNLVAKEVPEVVIQTGPVDISTNIDFTYDGRYMLSHTLFSGELLVWDLSQSKILKRYSGRFDTTRFCPNSYNIVTLSSTNAHFIEWRKKTNYGSSLHKIQNLNFPLAQSLLNEVRSVPLELSKKARKKIEKIYGVNEYRHTKSCGTKSAFFTTPSWDNKVSDLIVYDENSDSLRIYSVSNVTLAYDKRLLGFYDDKYIIYNEDDYSICFLNISSGEVEIRLKGSRSSDGNSARSVDLISWSNDGNTLCSFHRSGRLEIINLESCTNVETVKISSKHFNLNKFINFRSNVFTSIVTEDQKEGLIVISLNEGFKPILIYSSKDTTNLGTNQFDFYRFDRISTFIDVQMNNLGTKLALLSFMADSNESFENKGRFYLEIFDISSRKVTFSRQVASNSICAGNVSASHDFQSFLIYCDGEMSKKSQIELEKNGFKYDGLSNCVYHIDVNKGFEKRIRMRDIGVDGLNSNGIYSNGIYFSNQSRDSVYIYDSYNSRLSFYDLKNNKKIKLIGGNNYLDSEERNKIGFINRPIELDLKGNRVFHSGLASTDYTGRNMKIQCSSLDEDEVLFKIETNDSSPSVFSYNDPKKLLAVGTNLNEILLFDVESKNIILKIYAHEGNTLFMTPDGYYMSDVSDIKNLSFRFGNKLYSFDQFDLIFNRPDIVLSQMGLADKKKVRDLKKAYEKRIEKNGLQNLNTSNFGSAPKVNLNIVGGTRPITSKNKIRLIVTVSGENIPIQSLNFWVNNVPYNLDSHKGLSYQHRLEVVDTLEFTLSVGKNIIEVSCVNNQGLRSLVESVEVVYSPLNQVTKNIYLIGIGVSEFQDIKSLPNSDNDIRDFINLYLNKIDSPFEVNVIDTLINTDVSKENFNNLFGKYPEMNIDDVVILFYSGHGIPNSDGNYFLYTHDSSPSNIEDTGIKMVEVQSLMDSFSSRNKIALINACHSGEVDADMATFKLFQETFPETRRGSGTFYISSSFSDSPSLTSSTKFGNNSAFGRALELVLSESQSLSVNTLKKEVEAATLSLSGNRQQPTFRQDNPKVDFRVW